MGLVHAALQGMVDRLHAGPQLHIIQHCMHAGTEPLQQATTAVASSVPTVVWCAACYYATGIKQLQQPPPEQPLIPSMLEPLCRKSYAKWLLQGSKAAQNENGMPHAYGANSPAIQRGSELLPGFCTRPMSAKASSCEPCAARPAAKGLRTRACRQAFTMTVHLFWVCGKLRNKTEGVFAICGQTLQAVYGLSVSKQQTCC